MEIYNKKVLSFFKKNYKALLLFFLILASIAALLQYLFIERSSEKKIIPELLKDNSAIQEYFGSLEKIQDDRSMGAHVSYYIGGKKGYFFYKIEGMSKKGVIKVDWQKNKTEELRIKEINVVVPEQRNLYNATQ